MAQFALTGSIYSTLAITIERYLTVWVGLCIAKWSSRGNDKTLIKIGILWKHTAKGNDEITMTTISQDVEG